MDARYCRLRRNGSTSMFHTRADFDAVIKAHNSLVDYCESLEKRIEELERKCQEQKAVER